jgi:hypothetical protein
VGNEANIPKLSIGEYAFQRCAKLGDFVGAETDSIDIIAIGEGAFGYCPSLNYDMLDKIHGVAGTEKVKDDSGSKQHI